MKKSTFNLLLSSVLITTAAVAAGCSSDTTAMQTGTGGSGGGGKSGGGTGVGVAITPDATGWVMADTNTLGIQGAWYAYGDGIGADGTAAMGSCMKAGHTASECTVITTPAPGPFANTGGKMCTSGKAAKVVDIVGKTGMPDYSAIWGAGIGLDLAASGGTASTKSTFDATTKKVVGVSFDLDSVPLSGLRVEFATPSTNGSSAGNDYWGGNASYGNSPVAAGPNSVTWDKISGPGAAAHVFTPGAIESIQFHVPTNTTAAGDYSFCISNLKFLM